MRKVRLGKAKDLSRLGIQVEKLFVYKPSSSPRMPWLCGWLRYANTETIQIFNDQPVLDRRCLQLYPAYQNTHLVSPSADLHLLRLFD